MKSAFSRLLFTLSLILLAAMVMVSGSFQWLASRHLTNQTITSLENDAKVIASLYQAGYADKGISQQDFFMALTVAVSVSGADAVICDADGTLLMCANAPMGCEHQGLQVNKAFCNKVNQYMAEENEYHGEAEVYHYLEMLRDIVGFDKVKECVKNSLKGKKIAAYYGCLLLRPNKVMRMDDPENPTVIEDLIRALGAEAIIYARRKECCGA